MPDELTAGQRAVGDVAPHLAELTDDVLFGDVWERPGLSKRDRSLITVAALVALYRTNELPGHLQRALDNGLTREEIAEVLTHLALFRRLALRGHGCEARERGARRAGLNVGGPTRHASRPGSALAHQRTPASPEAAARTGS